MRVALERSGLLATAGMFVLDSSLAIVAGREHMGYFICDS